MGVPGFFRWLVNRYPQILRPLTDQSRPRFNNCYIDMNGIFYYAAEIANQKSGPLSTDFKSEVCRYLDFIVQVCQPTNNLFISVDGPAPFAKNQQQRARRYRSASEASPGSFDRCSFSPGTEVMDEIHKLLEKFIEDKRNSDSTWKKPNVYYSSCYVPGEGEHKIMNWIRSARTSPDWDPNQTHVIVASDADLIFLALKTHEPYFHIIREIFRYPPVLNLKWSKDLFEIMHVSLLREYLAHDFNVQGEELEFLIDDFVAISFLIGNDFIPEFFDISLHHGNFNNIIEVFRKVRSSRKDRLVYDDQYNKAFLKEFLEGVANNLKEQYESNPSNQVPYEEYLRQYILSKYPEHQNNLDALIKDMSLNILDSFNWVLRYYTFGCPSWNWRFKYHYSPPIYLTINYIDEYEPKFEIGAPNVPFLQLLYVLPPQSSKLLPTVLQPLMFPPSPISHYYPDKFEIDLNNKKTDYTAIVKIPIINSDEVYEEYRKVSDALLEDELERNQLRKTIFYKKDSKQAIEIDIENVKLLPTNLATQKPPCVATFETYDNVKYVEEKVPVCVFEYESKFESLIVEIDPKLRQKEFQEAKQLIDKPILYDWPFLKQGKIVAVQSGDQYEKSKNYDEIPRASSPKYLENHFLKRYGTRIGSTTTIFQIVPFVSSNFDETIFRYTNEFISVPSQLTLPIDANNAAMRFKSPPSSPPKVGTLVLFTRGRNENKIGEVIEAKNDFLFKVHMRDKRQPKLDKLLSNVNNQYVTDEQLTKTLGVSFRTLNTILSSIVIHPNKVNIAFTLFTHDKKMCIPFLCKFENKKLFVHKSLVPLLQKYVKMSGKLIQILNNFKKSKSSDLKESQKSHFSGKGKRINDEANSSQSQPEKLSEPTTEPLPTPSPQNSNNNAINLSDIFSGSEENQKKQLTILTDWLQSNSPAKHYEMTSSDNSSLPLDIINKIEKELQKYKPMCIEKDIDDVNSSDITWATKYESTTLSIVPSLGSRVISISESGPAPFGSFGTVISINKYRSSAVVLFDEVLPCGTKYKGILQTNRALNLMFNDLYII